MLTRKVFNGDCRLLLPAIPSESVEGIFTDPPFNIALQPQRKLHGEIANDALSETEFQSMLETVIAECFRVLRSDRAAWFCCNWNCFAEMESAIVKAGFEIENCVVWVKNNFGIGYHLRPQHEFIILAFKGKPPVPSESLSNVWHVERLITTVHPTEKPTKLVRMALQRYNKPGDTILDPFAGSFSTCVTAKNMEMGYIGIELLPNFYEAGVKRLEEGIVDVVNANGTKIQRQEGNPLLDFIND